VKPKIFLCGQKYFGWAVFTKLRALGYDIVGVSAPYSESKPDRLYKAAVGLDVPYLVKGGALTAETFPDGVDLVVAAHSYDYVGLKTLRKARLGGIGYHPSLLPVHRGRDAIRWAIRMDDPVTGGTVYWLSKGVDCGPIAAQDWCFIPHGWDAETLWRERLQPMGVRLIVKTLADIEAGKLVKMPQEPDCATWEPALDQPPIFRPDLAQLGSVEGFEVVSSRGVDDWDWRRIAGG